MNSGRRERRQAVAALLLVAGGAIPGALLRWQLQTLLAGGGAAVSGTLVANLSGCLLLGALTAGPQPRVQLMLWAGIGFCGSLTTFSSWMLELMRALERGQTQTSIQMLLANLVGGLLLVGLGRHACSRWFSRPGQMGPPARRQRNNS